MNGIRYVLDTNSVIAMINGNDQLLQKTRYASFVGLSIISVVEFLSFSGINEADKGLLMDLISETDVINLHADNTALLDIIATVRITYRLKLPDAIIAATALYKGATLISNDKHFQNITALSVLRF
jgi:tRNA(fMet)-specific endonuclease VapC